MSNNFYQEGNSVLVCTNSRTMVIGTYPNPRAAREACLVLNHIIESEHTNGILHGIERAGEIAQIERKESESTIEQGAQPAFDLRAVSKSSIQRKPSNQCDLTELATLVEKCEFSCVAGPLRYNIDWIELCVRLREVE